MASINTNIHGERVVWYTVAETAQMVRTALKAAFPGVKFSVRSRSYSGGASVDVEWTDGPNTESVKAITDTYEGTTFDGMTDSKDIRDVLVNGHHVRYGADSIHENRHLSATYLRAVAERVARYYRLPVPAIHDEGKYAWIDRYGLNSPVINESGPSGAETLGDIILQRARETAAPAA